MQYFIHAIKAKKSAVMPPQFYSQVRTDKFRLNCWAVGNDEFMIWQMGSMYEESLIVVNRELTKCWVMGDGGDRLPSNILESKPNYRRVIQGLIDVFESKKAQMIETEVEK